MKFESKYGLGDTVRISTGEAGKIIGVKFTQNGIIFDIIGEGMVWPDNYMAIPEKHLLTE